MIDWGFIAGWLSILAIVGAVVARGAKPGSDGTHRQADLQILLRQGGQEYRVDFHFGRGTRAPRLTATVCRRSTEGWLPIATWAEPGPGRPRRHTEHYFAERAEELVGATRI